METQMIELSNVDLWDKRQFHKGDMSWKNNKVSKCVGL